MSADGILVVNKPGGRSSRWATNLAGRLLSEKKAGHVGTLDPRASGVLPVALGRATRLVRFLESGAKDYRGIIRLGITTDTQDADGETVAERDWSRVTREAVTAAAAGFSGEILQVPPMFSALKKDGRPLYQLAREGREVEREPRRVTVYSFEVEAVELPEVTVRVRCSPGTYVRTLAADLGERLSCGGHLKSLTRLASGPFTLEQAVILADLDEAKARAALIPLAACLPHLPAIELTEAEAALARDGREILRENVAGLGPEGLCRLMSDGSLLAVARAEVEDERSLLKPVRVIA